MALARNDNQIDFPDATGSWGNVTHVGVRVGATFKGGSDLTTALNINTAGEVYFPANSLGLRIDRGEFTNAAAAEALAAIYGTGNITLSLHTGDPGMTGANEVPSQNGYARVNYAVSALTVTAS